MLTFQGVRTINESRKARWHAGGNRTWTPSDWSNALAGETGEVCNAVKKLMRIRDGLMNISEEARALTTEREAVEKIGKECGDVFLYLDLLCQDLGISLEDAVKSVFNQKSKEYGFPERL